MTNGFHKRNLSYNWLRSSRKTNDGRSIISSWHHIVLCFRVWLASVGMCDARWWGDEGDCSVTESDCRPLKLERWRCVPELCGKVKVGRKRNLVKDRFFSKRSGLGGVVKGRIVKKWDGKLLRSEIFEEEEKMETAKYQEPFRVGCHHLHHNFQHHHHHRHHHWQEDSHCQVSGTI